MEHMPGATRLLALADLALTRDAFNPFLPLWHVVRPSLEPRGVFADADRTAIVIESLRTPMPRSIIERAAAGTECAAAAHHMVWSPGNATMKRRRRGPGYAAYYVSGKLFACIYGKKDISVFRTSEFVSHIQDRKGKNI